MAHDVDVDPGPGLADDAADHRAAGKALPARPAARSHDDLRRVQGARGLEQRGADVSADDLVVRAAELVEQLALLLEQGCTRRREPVLRDHVHADEVTLRALRDPCGSADQALAVGRAGQRDEDALASLPRIGDAVPRPVVREGLVDPVPDPGERELAERRQVARPEVVRERRVDTLGRVDVATCEAVAECNGGEVDELDLVGAAHDLVGDRLALLDAGDLFDDVVQRLEVLHVHRGDDADPGRQQLFHVLPALPVARSRRVRVRELVDERDLR